MNMTKTIWVAALAIAATVSTACAQVPGIIQYQGRVTSNGTNFTGKGGFKFAIIETAITGNSVWSNDGTSNNGSEPTQPVSVTVDDGLFIVGLGDTSVSGMLTIPAAIFSYQNLKLRIWFSDGVGAYAALSPDQKITSVGFAMMAVSVSDGAITTLKLASEAVTWDKLAPGAVTGDKIAPGTVAGTNLMNQTINGSKIVSNSLTSAEIADTLTLQQLNLGSSAWNGALNLWASGVNESRGLLAGDGNGSLLNLLFANNATGAVLSVRSPAAKLKLWDLSGFETVQLGGSATGGELSLFQINGQAGIFLDGQGTSGGGEIRVMDSAGNTTTAELLGAETANTGARLRLRRANGTLTLAFDAENDGAGNPRVDFYKGDGTTTMAFLPGGGDAGLAGGGLIRLGELTGSNLGIDDNEIIARNNGAAAPLYLNYGSNAIVYTSKLAINTATPAAGYLLSVNGKVICEELVVQISSEWPDYVFAEDYQLMPLQELEAKIREHKHLPGIPTARQVGTEGVPVGEMQRQMMEKIEELTLYLLQQNQRLGAQEAELARLRAQVNGSK